MTTTPATLRHVRAVLFDMDGVIYVGKQPLPGVRELLSYLDATDRRWMFVTNNAGMTSAQFTAKLQDMGFAVPPERILGSSEATAQWLRTQVAQHGWPDGKVIVLGMEGLRAALCNQAFELTADPAAAAYAVAGIHTELTYRELSDVTLAIRAGARFIGTNGDRTLPSERGQVPGAGSILALLEAATDVKPIVIGKPNAPMFEIALQRLGVTPSQTLMVGDRYETDIAGAQTLGMTTAAVLTGVHTREMFERQAWPPDFIVPGLSELLAKFRE
jgi:4-nitrophenyl phosphatase